MNVVGEILCLLVFVALLCMFHFSFGLDARALFMGALIGTIMTMIYDAGRRR